MRFGIFDHVERRADVDTPQQFAERLELVALADQAGYFCYHVAEHHNSPLCLAPNQAIYLAAVAQKTSRIRLSTLVYVLPLHNPIRLIEEICLVDQLSNGRFEVGVGRGTDRAQELRMWGGDAAENDGRFEETLDVVIAGLQTDFLTHHGRFFNYDDLWMELRPVQKPHPPFWWPGSPQHCGEWGMNFLGAGRVQMPAVREEMDRYLAAFRASPNKGLCGRAEPLYGAQKHIYVAGTDDEARERVRSAYESFRGHFLKPLPGGRIDPEEIPIPARMDVDTALGSGGFVYGSPATVRDYVRQYVEQSGANYLVNAYHWGDLTHEEAKRSMTLFASEVMPAFAEADAAVG